MRPMVMKHFRSLAAFALFVMALSFPALVLADSCLSYQHHLRHVGLVDEISNTDWMVNLGSWVVFDNEDGALVSIDMSDPQNPQPGTVLDLGGAVLGLELGQNDHILATVLDVGLVIVTLEPDGSLVQVSVLEFTGNIQHLAVSGDRACVHRLYQVLAFVDWSNPAEPAVLGEILLSDFWPTSLAIRGAEVFVAGVDPDYYPALWRVDFSDPQAPAVVGGGPVLPYPENQESMISDIVPTADQVHLAYTRVIRLGPMDFDLEMSLLTLPADGLYAPETAALCEVGSGETSVLHLDENKAYLFGSKLAVLDLQNPSAPNLQGHVNLTGQVCSGVLLNGFALACRNQPGAHLVDLGNETTPPATLLLENEHGFTDLISGPGNLVYGIAAQPGDWNYDGFMELVAWDFSDPANPIEVGRYVDPRSYPPYFHSLRWWGDHLVAFGDGFLGVFDVGDPASPALVEEIAGGGDNDFVFMGSHLYWPDHVGNLKLYDASNPEDILPVGTTSLEGVYGVEASGDVLLVARNDGGGWLQTYEVDDPLNPTLVGSWSADTVYYHLWLMQDRLYAQGYWGPVQIYDVSDPAAVESLGAIPLNNQMKSISLVEDLAYVAVRWEGMLVVDLGDILQPRKLGGIPTGAYGAGLALVDQQPVFCDRTLVYLAAPQCSLSPVEEQEDIPEIQARVVAYPNPFNPRVQLRIFLPGAAEAAVQIHDLAGRRVKEFGQTQVENQWLELQWNGNDDAGRALPSGTYLVQVSGVDFQGVAKVTLLR